MSLSLVLPLAVELTLVPPFMSERRPMLILEKPPERSPLWENILSGILKLT